MKPTHKKDAKGSLGFAIVTKKHKQVHHFGIIAGRSSCVEKMLRTKPTESIVMGFTPIANPIFYRNNVVAKVHERLREAVDETNATFAVAKKQSDQDIQSHIEALEQERDEANRQYMQHLRAWSDLESAKSAHNAYNALPPKERMPQRELPEVDTPMGIKEEPRFTDFITVQRLVDITQEITQLKCELSSPARRIAVQDIPVAATALACVWVENKWFDLEALHVIFHEVLREMRATDTNIAEQIKIMDAEGDDLTSMLMPDANVDKLARSTSPVTQSTGKAGPSYHYRRILGGQCDNGTYKVLIDWQPTLEPIEMIEDPAERAFWKEEIDKTC